MRYRADPGLVILLFGLGYAWWPPGPSERAPWLLLWLIVSTLALWLTRPAKAPQELPEHHTGALEPVRLGAELAHDFRTPLTRLRLQLAALADTQAVDADRVAAMDAEILQLERLAEDFIDLSAPDTAWPRDSEGPLDLAEAVRSELERVRPIFDLQGRPLEARLGVVQPVRCGTGRLERMLQNLLSNALRYAEGPGPITLRLLMDGPLHVALSIENPAPRPASDVRSLLDPFVRGEGADARAQGFGLGLAVTARLAAVSGARLHLKYHEDRSSFEARLVFPRLGPQV